MSRTGRHRVTGGIATGKSSVLAILSEHGVETIDADIVYHQLIAPGGSLVVPIANRFGRDMIAEDGSITAALWPESSSPIAKRWPISMRLPIRR